MRPATLYTLKAETIMVNPLQDYCLYVTKNLPANLLVMDV